MSFFVMTNLGGSNDSAIKSANKCKTQLQDGLNPARVPF